MEGDRLRRVPLRDNVTGEGLILTVLALTALGVVTVFSVTWAHESERPWHTHRAVRQAIFAAVGMLIVLVGWRIDYRRLARRPWSGRRALKWVPSPAWLLLGVGALTAAAILIPGVTRQVRGSLRWMRFWRVSFQPSEVLKFAVLVFLAALLGRRGARPRSFVRTFIPAALVIGVAAGLVVTEDFGTAAIICIAAAGLLLMGEVPWYYLLTLVPFVIGGFYTFVVRTPGRWARIEAMLDPMNTTNPSTFQPRQALIAIATGSQPAGIGGSVAKHGYLPEPGTDFIYTIICEEQGLLGACLVIALMLVWLWLVGRTVRLAADRFGALLAGGLGFTVALQAAMHIAVNVSRLPPTGISLPFISVGGSSLLAMSAAAALVVSVSARRAAEGDRGLSPDSAAPAAGPRSRP